jgi:hypothetical protein
MATTLPASGPKTLACDKGYDSRDFVADLRNRGLTPHVTQNTSGRRSAIDGRTTRHGGYTASLRVRKRIEEIFGWQPTKLLGPEGIHGGLAGPQSTSTPSASLRPFPALPSPGPPGARHSAANFVGRLCAEQWVTFPRFVWSGGWWANFTRADKT